MRRIYSVMVLFLMSVAVMAQTADSDAVLKTLQEELKYNMEQLRQKPVPAYFMSLRLADEQELSVASSFGAAQTSSGATKYVVPTVRLGSKELDNYKYEQQGIDNPNNRSAQGAKVALNEGALRQYRDEIWNATMDRYNIAVKRYEEAKARTKTDAEYEDNAPCFSDAPVESYYEPALSKWVVDTVAWKQRLNNVTRVFKECRLLNEGEASINFVTERIYIVNTDGTSVVHNKRYVRIMLSAQIKANDGMPCPLYTDFFGFSEDDLPTEERLIDAAKDLVQRLLALREAPMADPYTGPAILSGSASGVFFHEIFVVDAAAATSVSNFTPDFGETITISGENLDLISEINFPSAGAVKPIAQDRNSITVTVPANATSGDIILISPSGLTTSINVTLPLASYEAASISPAKNLKAGLTVSFKGDNLDRVAKLVLPGDITLEKGQFTQSKNAISFVVPEEMGDGKVLLVQHENWSIETDRIAMYAPEGPVKVLWKGNKALGWSGDGQVYLGTDGGPELVEAGAKPGDKLRIKLEPTSAGWAAQIWEGHWGSQLDEIKAENYDLDGEGGYYTITLTEENLKTFTTAQGWGGIVLTQGQDCNVTELALVQKAEGIVIWKDTKALGWSGDGQVYIGTDGGPELLEAGAKPGDKLIISLEPTADDWCAQIWDGHWGAQIEEIKAENYDLAANGGYVITLTADNIATFTSAQGWGGMLLVQGQSMNVTKLTLVQK